MDRFVWASSNKLEEVERVLAHITGVRIYDGENKVRLCFTTELYFYSYFVLFLVGKLHPLPQRTPTRKFRPNTPVAYSIRS